MTQVRTVPRRLPSSQSGTAALEFAIVFPLLLLLFFGMVNITDFISTKRKVQSAAELIADMVTRQQTTIPSTLIDDYFKAVELTFRPMDQTTAQATIGIDLYGYRLVDSKAQVIWSKYYLGTRRCSVPSVSMNNTDPIGSLLGDSDVVVAVVCRSYTAPAANYPGLQFLANQKIEKQFVLRPRQTTILNCTPNGCP